MGLAERARAAQPSLLPFAFVGVNHRSWWLVFGVLVLVSIPFGGLWPDYVTAMRNSDLGAFHALRTVPFFVAPIIAWLWRTGDDRRGRPLVYGRIPWPRQLQRRAIRNEVVQESGDPGLRLVVCAVRAEASSEPARRPAEAAFDPSASTGIRTMGKSELLELRPVAFRITCR